MAPVYDAVTTRVFPHLEHDRMALKLNGRDDKLLAFTFAEPDHADLVRLRVGDARQRLLDEVFRRRDHRPGHAFVERALHAARERREGAAVDAGVNRQRGIETAVGFDRLVGLHAIAKEIRIVGHSGTHQRQGSCRKGRRFSERVIKAPMPDTGWRDGRRAGGQPR